MEVSLIHFYFFVWNSIYFNMHLDYLLLTVNIMFILLFFTIEIKCLQVLCIIIYACDYFNENWHLRTCTCKFMMCGVLYNRTAGLGDAASVRLYVAQR